MKKTIRLWFLVFQFSLVGLAVASITHAGVIFQDDFESDGANWTCGSGQLVKWSEGWIECGQSSGFGYEWKMGPGRDGGKAVYAWKKDTVPNGYRSASEKWLSGAEPASEVYHRWYMKVPSGFDKAISEGFKLWRYILRESGYSNAPQLYLNVSGSTFASGALAVSQGSWEWKTLTKVSNFNDGNWHCHELRIKLNSNGQSDGIIQYWLDGTLKATHSNLSFSSVQNLKIHRFGVGIGNVSDSPWYMTNWTGVGFDDVVLSTSYIGPAGGSSGDTAPPVVLSALPSGAQTCTSNPQSVNLQVSTDENATCRYGTMDASYSSLPSVFGTTGGTSHTQTVSASCGTAYTYYVRCADSVANQSAISTPISFSIAAASTGGGGELLLTEGSDDADFASRGWYDYASPVIDTTIKRSGAASLKYQFNKGSNGPVGRVGRQSISPTEALYLSFWIRFGSGWQGFGANSPHMVYFLTTENGDWDGLAWTKTTAYVEVDGSSNGYHVPAVKLQDSANIDTAYLNQSLCSASENRGVNGCNGDCDGHGNGQCYNGGDGNYYNARAFSSASSYAPDTNWHHVEAYFKMNTISGGRGQKDGLIKMWWDGALVVDKPGIIIRTGEHPTMKFNQIILAPYGAASPIQQTFWIDDLEVRSEYPGEQTPDGPATPKNVRIETKN